MTGRIGLGLLTLLLVATYPGSLTAQPLFSTRVGTGFSEPLFGTSAPGNPGTLYVVERGGTIRTLNTTTGAVGTTPVLNVPSITGTNFLSTGGEQGLLGLAFHPNFQTNGQFYVNYTFGTGSGSTRVERYTYNFTTNTANPASRQTVLEFTQPFANHNGGWLGFGPRDGFLYIASGDGGSGNDPQNNAQNRNTLLGKMLRIDVNSTSGGNNYAIPVSNPFANNPGERGEIWAYGLRNPWRPSFDRTTGNLYIADVGQGAREEINFQSGTSAGGQNYGWRVREGTLGAALPGSTDPIHEYDRTVGASITGGYVYRGGALLDNGQPLDGTYFFADFISGRLFSFRYDGTTLTDLRERTSQLQNASNGGSTGNISSFAEDGFGNLYVVSFGGSIFRVSGTAVPEPGTLVLSGAAAALALRLRRRGPGARAGEGRLPCCEDRHARLE